MIQTTVMWRTFLLSLVFVGISGAQASLETYKFPPEGRSVLNASLGKELLQSRCSRVPPKNIEAFWAPSNEAIANMEQRLPNYLIKQTNSNGGAQVPPPGTYDRQYLGIVVKGTHLIYGNYYPSGKMVAPSDSLVGICDGGPSFWGITFNPRTYRFANLSLSAG